MRLNSSFKFRILINKNCLFNLFTTLTEAQNFEYFNRCTICQTKHQLIPRTRSVRCSNLIVWPSTVIYHLASVRLYSTYVLLPTVNIVLLLPGQTTGYTTQIRNIDYNLTSQVTFPLSIILLRYSHDINWVGEFNLLPTIS